MNGPLEPNPLPPPPQAGSQRLGVDGRTRPRWSTIDTWPVFILVALALLTLLVPAETDDGVSTTEAAAVTGAALFFAIFVQQLIQFAWPWIVSKWKGLGLVPDWRFTIDWKRDIGIGALLTVGAVVLSTIVTAIMTAVVGLSTEEDPSNTSIISDNEGSPWLIGIILLVVIGAPLSEELLFRGLTLRALERDLGIYVGVIGSTILFTLPHIQAGATGGETVVLLSGLFVVGLIWGIATAHFGRLGPSIISHVFFNAFGTVMTVVG